MALIPFALPRASQFVNVQANGYPNGYRTDTVRYILSAYQHVSQSRRMIQLIMCCSTSCHVQAVLPDPLPISCTRTPPSHTPPTPGPTPLLGVPPSRYLPHIFKSFPLPEKIPQNFPIKIFSLTVFFFSVYRQFRVSD